MSYLSERVQYLKGLADGMKLDETTDNGKLLAAIIDVLEDVSGAMEEVVDIQDDMQEQLDEVDEDLAELEEDYYDDCDECDCCDDDCDGVTLECPSCGDEIYIDFDAVEEDGLVTCPGCGEEFELSFDCDEDCDCCDHDCCDGEE